MKFVKIMALLAAALLCISAVGCKSADGGKILSSDDAAKVIDSVPDELYVGQKIEGLGSYEGKALSWTVAEVDREGIATLVCDEIIDTKAFYSERDISLIRGNETPDLYDELFVLNWENSGIREWLNDYFLEAAFSETEQELLVNASLVTNNNPLTDKGECTTVDRVFLLSAEEAKAYFATDSARRINATDHAKAAGIRIGAEYGTSAYWLRSSGESIWHAACVNTDGSINYSGMSVENLRVGVRPAVRLVSTVPGGEPIVALSSALLGDLVEFGTYEQDNDLLTTDEAIVWRVIDKEGSKLMLISEKVLDACAFNTALNGTKWANSELRTFLNGSFVDKAFSASEQAMLADTLNATADNAEYAVDSGADSTDKVFVLSKEEAEKYLLARNGSWELAKATPYSQDRAEVGGTYDFGVSVDPDYGTAGWWLRNAGENDLNAMYMFYYGAVCEKGTLCRNTFVGVRPCIWVDTAAN